MSEITCTRTILAAFSLLESESQANTGVWPTVDGCHRVAGTTSGSWDTLIQNSARTRHSDAYGMVVLVIRAAMGQSVKTRGGNFVFSDEEVSCDKSIFRRTANTETPFAISSVGNDETRQSLSHGSKAMASCRHIADLRSGQSKAQARCKEGSGDQRFCGCGGGSSAGLRTTPLVRIVQTGDDRSRVQHIAELKASSSSRLEGPLVTAPWEKNVVPNYHLFIFGHLFWGPIT